MSCLKNSYKNVKELLDKISNSGFDFMIGITQNSQGNAIKRTDLM